MRLPRFTPVLFWLFALILLLWAAHLKDPHLFGIRRWETLLLLTLAALGGRIVWRQARGHGRSALLGTLALVVGLTVFGEAQTRYRQYAVRHLPPQIAAQLGPHFIVGYTDPAELRALVINARIGGIFVTHRNAAGKSTSQLAQEIADLQALRHAHKLPPLFVATDQEGGPVSRLSPPLPVHPPLASLVETSRSVSELENRARAYGELQGGELAALGVNVDFSPVVDLGLPHSANPLDLHTRISTRAISGNPLVVTRVALAYSLGLRQQGVIATLKHFPGLGRVTEDTHNFTARLNTPTAVLSAQDWVPFRQTAAPSGAFIMLGHVILPDVDPDTPASFSRPVVQHILRGEWKHDGVLVTDDLTMAPAYNRSLCATTVKALNAGVDMLLIAYDHEKIADALYCARQALENGQIDTRLLAQSSARLQHALQDIAPRTMIAQH